LNDFNKRVQFVMLLVLRSITQILFINYTELLILHIYLKYHVY